MHSDSRLRIVRLKLTATEALISGQTIELVLGRHSPQIVLGPNGAGKSLLVAALRAFSNRSENRLDEIRELFSAGVRGLQIELAFRNWMGYGQLDFSDGNRSLNWNPVPSTWEHARGESDSQDENGFAGEIQCFDLDLDAVHVVERGVLSRSWSDEDIDEIKSRVARPLERELVTWNQRLQQLGGDDEKSGKLFDARHQLTGAERQLEHVTRLHAEYEQCKQRLQTLTLAVADLFATGEMLKAERAALDSLCTSADRAERLHKWIEEIGLSMSKTDEICENIHRAEESIRHLDRRFSNAPANLPELVRTYVATRDHERELRAQIDMLEQDRALAERTARQCRDELEQLKLSPVEDMQSLTHSAREEISRLDARLTDFNRQHIELVRQRDGLESQFVHLCPEFTSINDESVIQVVRLLDMRTDITAHSHVARIESEDEFRRTESARRDIRARLSTQFSDYDRLPANTPDLLKELADRRRIMATLMADVDQLKRRQERAMEKANPTAKLIGIALTALAGFAVGTWAQSWDIGLFLAVISSGTALLLLKFFHRGTEQKLDSIVGAQAMSASRLKDVRERIDKLDKQLFPLSAIGHLDDALNLYGEYSKLQQDQEQLRTADVADDKTPQSLESELRSIESVLPPAICALSTEQLRQKLTDFMSVRERQAAHDELCAPFREDGAVAVESRVIEARLLQLKTELTEIEAKHQALMTEFNLRRADVESRVAHIESTAVESPLLVSARAELSVVETRLKNLADATGHVLNQAAPETVELEWNARQSQQAELARLQLDLKRQLPQSELSARIDLLREEFSDIRTKLQELDPLYLLDGGPQEFALKYRDQRAAADQAIEANLADIERTQQELRSLDSEPFSQAILAEPSLETLLTKVSDARGAFEAAEREVNATRELRDAVQQEIDGLNREFKIDFVTAIRSQLRTLSDQGFTDCAIHDRELLLTTSTNNTRAATKFSEGVADLAGIALRIAAAQQLAAIDQRPFIWDEPFSRLDEQKVTRVRDAIYEIAQHRQVIILTRDPRLTAWGENFSLGKDPRVLAQTQAAV